MANVTKIMVEYISIIHIAGNKVGFDGYQLITEGNWDKIDCITVYEGISVGILHLFAATNWNAQKRNTIFL